ncbi:hypothetical protein HFK83_03350 [Ralstonia pseudosolanacearum]|uniref:hypothetical protein n=1 Tax=Ralstonia solanacearum species complex TaxID=3116862 RepID=UPI0003754D1B|nr:hypothetical protein [Ralstonia pseudosolanacearum]MCK4121406.1 hypothetical protein [Ralstonia pseudosolanacearum]
MKRSLVFRAQEWLADRVSWVQYPGIRPVAQQRRQFWTYPMPVWQRAYMALVSLFALAVFGVVLAVMLTIAYAFIRGAFA